MKRTIQKDDKGLFLVDHGQVVRPIFNGSAHYFRLDVEAYRVRNEQINDVAIRGYGKSDFSAGDRVHTGELHDQEIYSVRSLDGIKHEWWFLQDQDKERREEQ